MSRLGIIAALPGELRPLVREWRPVVLRGGLKGDLAWEGRVNQVECIAVAAGIGKDSAARACALVESVAANEGGLSGLVSLGWAGSLSCGLSLGRAYWVAEVVDVSTGERFPTNVSREPHLRLLTINHVAQPEEKRLLAESYRAVLVDMEAATVARIASGKGIAFYCIKAVSDSPVDVLPDFGRHIDAEGKIRMSGLLAQVAFQPRHWRTMARMGKNSKIGASALAVGLRNFIGDETIT